MWGADSNTVTVATIVNNVNTNRQNLQRKKVLLIIIYSEFEMKARDFALDVINELASRVELA